MSPETVSLQTLDGVTLEADLVQVDSDHPRAFVIAAHPHPQYGGDRNNHVVRTIQTVAHALGCHSIAPDFRGAGGSMGMFDDGNSERLDLAAACELAAFIAEDAPIIMCGYSFGAAVSLNVVHTGIVGWLAVAPPAVMLSETPVAAGSHLPKHILIPEHDQFTSLDRITEVTASWRNTTVEMIPVEDHFIASGATAQLTAAMQAILLGN